MSYQSYLEASGRIECIVGNRIDRDAVAWFDRSIDCDTRMGDRLYADPVAASSNTCVPKPLSSNTDLHTAVCAGYGCARPQSFLVTPDRENTFHNYAVAQNKERTLFCSENHQFFNNMTRRKIAVTPPSFSAAGVPIDQDPIPMPEMCDVFAQLSNKKNK